MAVCLGLSEQANNQEEDMAMPRKIPVEFGQVFPHGVYAVGEVGMVKDFDKSTREKPVQQSDPETGMPMWAVDVIDADPEATKSTRSVTVKVIAKVQPVLPAEANGLPFRPVEFEGLTATPYVDDNGNFARIAYSFRASGVREPSKGTRPVPEKAA